MTEATTQPNEEQRPAQPGAAQLGPAPPDPSQTTPPPAVVADASAPAPGADSVDPIANPNILKRVIRGLGAIYASFWLSVTAVAMIVSAVISMVWLFPGEPTFAGWLGQLGLILMFLSGFLAYGGFVLCCLPPPLKRLAILCMLLILTASGSLLFSVLNFGGELFLEQKANAAFQTVGIKLGLTTEVLFMAYLAILCGYFQRKNLQSHAIALQVMFVLLIAIVLIGVLAGWELPGSSTPQVAAPQPDVRQALDPRFAQPQPPPQASSSSSLLMLLGLVGLGVFLLIMAGRYEWLLRNLRKELKQRKAQRHTGSTQPLGTQT